MATIQISSKSIHASVVWLTAILAFFLTSCTTHGTVQHMGIKTSYLNNEKHDKKYCNKEQGESRYTLDERVGRWKQCTTADEIKNFQDKGRHPYKKKTDKKVYQYQIFHNPTGIIDLLNGAYYDAYFTKESQESISAKASLLLIHKRKRQPRELYRKGTIEIGLDNADPSIIYHMMFRPEGNRPSLKIPYIIVMDEHGVKLERTTPHYQSQYKVDEHENERENIAPNWQYRKKENPNKKFFYKKDNVYVIQYIPTKKSCYKFVRLSIHTKGEASSCYSAS